MYWCLKFDEKNWLFDLFFSSTLIWATFVVAAILDCQKTTSSPFPGWTLQLFCCYHWSVCRDQWLLYHQTVVNETRVVAVSLLYNLLRSLLTPKICLYGQERSWELAGDELGCCQIEWVIFCILIFHICKKITNFWQKCKKIINE